VSHDSRDVQVSNCSTQYVDMRPLFTITRIHNLCSFIIHCEHDAFLFYRLIIAVAIRLNPHWSQGHAHIPLPVLTSRIHCRAVSRVCKTIAHYANLALACADCGKLSVHNIIWTRHYACMDGVVRPRKALQYWCSYQTPTMSKISE
jgi:hypothetical protein